MKDYTNTLVTLTGTTSVAYSDVPLLFFLCFKQHMIPPATISITPTAAMTPMMMTKTEIQQYTLVTFIAQR